MPATKVVKKVVKRAAAPRAASRAKDAEALRRDVNTAMKADVLKMGNDPSYTVQRLQSGCTPVDVLLGGGFARGRITELYGDWSTLKSFILMALIARTQADGGLCALIDTEGTYDPELALIVGVDTDALILEQPDTGEQGVDVTNLLVRSGKLDVIGWDSVAATTPRDEASFQESGEKSVQPGRLAGLMSRGLRKLNTANPSQGTALVFTNQTRLDIGKKFGDPTVTPGGRALPFYASTRLRLSKGTVVKDGDLIVGQEITASLIKSKISKPYRHTTFTFDYRIPGIDDVLWLISHGVVHGYVGNNGAQKYWDPRNPGKVLTHKGNFAKHITNNPELLEHMRSTALQIGVA